MLDAEVANVGAAAPAEAPTLRGLPLLGNLPHMRRDPIGLLTRAAAMGSDVVRIPVGPRDLFLIKGPENARYVLQENQKNFSKQTRGYAALRKVLGNGLVTSEGGFWLRQRRIAQPAFHRQRIAQFADTMVRLTEDMLPAFDAAARRGAPVDLATEMMTLTLRIVGWTLLSTEVAQESVRVSGALNALLHQVIERTTAIIDFPDVVPTPANLRLRRARAVLDDVVLRLIAERRRSGEDAGDLLGMLMSARDEETGEGMTDAQLRDEVMTIFLAGHETTANALTWTFYLLSSHPDVRRRLQNELSTVLGGRSPTFEDLPKLSYTLQVIQESMRLYPPVWILVRRSESDDVIAGFRVPKQAFVALPPFILHRDARIFERPEAFDPDRFAPDRASKLPRFAYLPFSGGPRVCIGNSFALMESQLILATLLQRFAFDLLPGHPVELDPAVTLRPRHGMQMTVRPA